MKKRIFQGLAIFFGLFIVALIAIPYFFKDTINQKIKEEINKKLLAKVDYKDFDLSLIRSFPNFRFYLYDFEVVGKDGFQGDTLVKLERLGITLNLWSVFKGQQYEIVSLQLNKPKINLKVLRDGKANWDIVKPDSALVEEQQDTSSAFALKLSYYEITDGQITYQDKQTPMFLSIQNLNHSGKGNIMTDVFDFSTRTSIQSLTFHYDGTSYLEKKDLEARINLGIDLKQQRYTLKDNEIKLNALTMSWDGFLQLGEGSYNIDLHFKSLNNDFKEVLSLVPGIYTKDFADIDASGHFGLQGYVKGVYQENRYPAFGLNLSVEQGQFKYSSLPLGVKDITFKLNVSNPTGNLEDTEVILKPFQADMGGNPIRVEWYSKGLNTMQIQSNIKAKLDLAKVQQFYPIEKMTLKGSLTCNAQIEGTYGKKQFPKTQADLTLKYGYIKSEDFNSVLENFNFESQILNPTGDYKDTKITISNLHAEIDKQPIEGHFLVNNLDNPHFQADITGVLNLEKLFKIYPIEGMQMKGIIEMQNLKTQGNQADVLAGRYEKVPTSGKMVIKNLLYHSDGYPDISIEEASCDFTPQKINIPNYRGKLGHSPVTLNGSVSNYLLYVLKNEPIKGEFELNSSSFDVNEWMTTSSTTSTSQADATTAMEPVDIPQNIDFTFRSNMQKLTYDKYTIENFQGKVTIKDKVLKVHQADFDLLGGRFKSSIAYDARDLKKPAVQFAMGFQHLKAKEMFRLFSFVRAFAPIVEQVEGLMDADFQYASLLKQDMYPDLTTVNCKGSAEIKDALAKGVSFIKEINKITKLDAPSELAIKGQKIGFEIQDGRLKVQPFDVRLGESNMNVSGSSGLDQSLDYLLKLNIPTGKVGTTVISHLNSLTKQNLSTPQSIRVDLSVGGNFRKPIIKPVGGSTEQSLQDQTKEQLNNLKEEAKEKVKQEFDKAKQEVEDKAKQEAERLKQEAEKKKREAEEKAKQEAERLKQEAEKKKREAEEKARQEAERLKKEAEEKAKEKLKWPFR